MLCAGPVVGAIPFVDLAGDVSLKESPPSASFVGVLEYRFVESDTVG